jgi:hypothetical protein
VGRYIVHFDSIDLSGQCGPLHKLFFLTIIVGHHGHRSGSRSDGGGSDEDSNNGRNGNKSLMNYSYCLLTPFQKQKQSGYARVRVKGKGKKGGNNETKISSFNFKLIRSYYSGIHYFCCSLQVMDTVLVNKKLNPKLV